MSNSTVSLLQLWRLCVESQGQGEDTMLEWNTLRKALEGLGCRVQALDCNTVDEIMQKHFSSRAGCEEPVSFTRYWRGMEAILHACGVFYGPLDPLIEKKVASLRSFRDAVLDELACNSQTPDADSYTMAQLRSLYQRLAHLAAISPEPQPEVLAYWQEKLRVLPLGEESFVTSDEIAAALLEWLEELLQDSLGDMSADIADGASDEDSLQSEDEAPTRSTLFGFDTADFGGGGGLAGTADFGRQLHAGRSGTAGDRFQTPFDLSGGGTFGAGMPLPRPPARLAPTADGQARGPGPPPPLSWAAEERGRASGSTPAWLRNPEPGERLEVRRFREALARRLDSDADGSELLISQLYSAVRDAVEAQQEASTPNSSTPRRRAARAAVFAAVSRLNGVKNRWLRRLFRDFETQALLCYRPQAIIPGAPEVGGRDIIADCVASQARAAEVLERRAACVPVAYRLAWLLARARRRSLCGVLARLRLLRDGRSAPAGSPPPSAAGDGVGPGFVSLSFEPSSEDRGSPAPKQSLSVGAATRGRGAASRNPPTRSPRTTLQHGSRSPPSESS